MTEDDLVESFKLPVSFTSDGRLLEIGPKSSNREKSYWIREKILAHPPADNVFLYRSSHEQLRVVKQIRREDGIQNYQRELQMMKRVLTEVEPNEKQLFVDLIGWFSSDDYIHIVLEYCPYGDISQHPTPMVEMNAWWICRQVIEGLSVLHRMGIIHRDIKPQNVLVDDINPTRVKIADFGISKLVHKDDERIATHPTTRIGTPGYMAPERLNLVERAGSSHTSAIDIWSLGCLMYYILTDSIPFTLQGSITYDSYKALEDYCSGSRPFPGVPLSRNGVSLSAQRFIQRLLAPLPHERPQASAHLMMDWEFPLPKNHDSSTTAEQPGTSQVPTIFSTNTVESRERFNYSDIFANEDDIDTPSSDLWYLMKFESRGQLDKDRLRFLLSSDASPEIYIQGYTALHIAAEQGTAESVRELLGHCTNPNARTRPNQEAAIHLATVQADFTLFKEKLELLLQSDADINIPNLEGDTVLHLAMRRMGNAEAIKFLLDQGASTKLKGQHGRTPLQYAVFLEREELADVLLAHGASPNCEDDDGVTPLHMAVKSKKLSMPLVESLIGKGYHINHEDNSQRTPLFEAATSGRRDFIRLLVDRGAKCWPHSAELEARIFQAYERPLFSLRIPWLSRSNPAE